MLSHLSLGIANMPRSKAFYDAVMGVLGYARVFTGVKALGYGLEDTGNDKLLLILQSEPVAPPGAGFHLAFVAPGRDAVDRFHSAALANGGVDQGAPGLRPQYGPDYYAAFVLDPDGHKLEAKYSPKYPQRD